jgi:hypothetical protein
MLGREMRRVEEAVQVHPNLRVPIIFADVSDRAEPDRSGGVDENVELLSILDRPVDHCLCGATVSDVAVVGDRFATLGLDLINDQLRPLRV